MILRCTLRGVMRVDQADSLWPEPSKKAVFVTPGDSTVTVTPAGASSSCSAST